MKDWSDDSYHTSVFTEEILSFLNASPSKRYIDATAGDGGHTIAVAEQGGKVLVVDRDSDALERIKKRLIGQTTIAKNITLAHGNFDNLKNIAAKYGFMSVDGIVFDLGMSTYQLKTGIRGFSVHGDWPLDMRMDRGQEKTAAEIINTYSEQELYELFAKYSQEHDSRVIAHAIVRVRSRKEPITTTKQLVEIIEQSTQNKGGMIHPATKVFQALRIDVNDEFEALKDALPQAVDILKEGGILAIISFHSGEDRIVKQFLRKENKIKLITKKPIVQTEEQNFINPRGRSAKLRVAEKYELSIS